MCAHYDGAGNKVHSTVEPDRFPILSLAAEDHPVPQGES